MECIEARALKSSVLSQMAMRTNFHNDDIRCLARINNCTTDDFVIEDLLNLDFPEIELQDEDSFDKDDEEKLSQKLNSNESSSIFSGADEFDSLSTEKLNVPVEDLENLEWLSQFVNDSTTEISLLLPSGSYTKKTGATLMNWIEPLSRPVQKVRVPIFPSPVPKKSRSKRSRSNTASSSSHGSSTPSPFILTNRVQNADWFLNLEKPMVKTMKRKLEAGSCFISGRRCTHCQVQKTPQWRSGPLGPKTLCNACGVRFKSGRLFPEYRPACSPTFSQEAHSNSHRKVLEMRWKKGKGGLGGNPV